MKLTITIRESIIKKVVSEKFKKTKTNLQDLRAKLADDCFNSIEDIAKIKSLPESWFLKSVHLNVRFNGLCDDLIMSNEQPLPRSTYSGGYLSFDSEHKFTKEWNRLKEIKSVIEIQEHELRNELKRVLYSVTTTQQLFKIWPESEKYIPQTPVSNLPTIIDVNKLRSLLEG